MDQNFSNNPYQQQPPLTPPKNWLVESILVTLFCCLPFGIVAIVFASQVNSKYSAGDYNSAMQASRDAKRWVMIAFWIGIVKAICGILWISFWGGWAYIHSHYYNNY
jgi:hypothetical protein